jgi:hypothetical protein
MATHGRNNISAYSSFSNKQCSSAEALPNGLAQMNMRGLTNA